MKQRLYLIMVLAKNWFKLRNEGSYLGILWYLLNPLLMFAVIMLAFKPLLSEQIPHYPLYVFLGIIMFNFFQQTTQEATKSVTEHRWLIKSLPLPLTTLIQAVTLKNSISHLFELLLFAILFVILGGPLLSLIWYPLAFIILALATYGLALTLSVLTPHFTDLENIYFFAVRLLWFVTPLFYLLSPATLLARMNMVNPLYYTITFARDTIIYGQFSLGIFLGALVSAIILFSIGIGTFKKFHAKVPELV